MRFSVLKSRIFKAYCLKYRKDYFVCNVFSKYAPVDDDNFYKWTYASFSYAEVSRFASMFTYVPDADIILSCVHFNKI